MSFPIGITHLSFPGSHHSIGPSRRATCFGHQSRHLAGPLRELDAVTIATPSGQPRLFRFVGSDTGPWTVLSARTRVGDALPPARCLSVVAGAAASPPSGTPWALAGIPSNERYLERHEKVALVGTHWCANGHERRVQHSRVRDDVHAGAKLSLASRRLPRLQARRLAGRSPAVRALRT